MRFLSLLPIVALSTLGAVSASTDIDTLNYALTLENLENYFYANNPFQASDYAAAGYSPSVATYINFIAAHEAAHVATLKSVITQLGGSPVVNCTTYPFTTATAYANVTTFLQTAALLEQTGVSAYDGAINTITNPGVQQAAATIATIEARHTNFITMILNNSTGVPAQNGAFDAPLPPQTVVTQVTPYLSNCPSTNVFAIPQVRNATNPSAQVQANNAAAGTVGQNDVNALQYALTLENFENAFYTTFVGQPGSNGGLFNASSFTKYPAGTFQYLQMIAGHEQAHATFLNQTIASFGAVGVSPCQYKFSSIQTPDDFVRNAAAIEQVGVSAYDGAINTINNVVVAQAAATIATVEARHSEFLNAINFAVLGGSPSALPNATNAFDPAVGPAATYAFVSSTFFGTCPSSNPVFNLPVVPGVNATVGSSGSASGSSGASGASGSSGASGQSGQSGASTGGGGGIIVGSSGASGAASTSSGAASTSSGAASTSSGAASTSSGAAAGSSGRNAASSLAPSVAALFASVVAFFGLKRAL